MPSAPGFSFERTPMMQTAQALVGVSAVAAFGFMLIFWTRSSRFVAPIIAAARKKSRNLRSVGGDLS